MATENISTRRSFLSSAALLTASAAATGALATIATQQALAEPVTPAVADLRRYYAFLWSEFQALGDELGVGQHDSFTAHGWGDIAAVGKLCTAPPSTRALGVLAAAGAGRELLTCPGYSWAEKV